MTEYTYGPVYYGKISG